MEEVHYGDEGLLWVVVPMKKKKKIEARYRLGECED